MPPSPETTQCEIDRELRELALLSIDLTHDRPLALTFEGDVVVTARDLDGSDPVPTMYGWTPPDHVTAVSFCAPATVTRSTSADLPEDHTVTHVLLRNGFAVTMLRTEDSIRWFGPTSTAQQGRVPDLCRRALRLPTPPPTESMTNFVICAWLEVVVRHALDRPDLGWDDLVELHPAHASVPSPMTPASLANATAMLGNALDWERFRVVISAVGGFPFGEHAMDIAKWMDSGMFSRWAIDSLPTRAETIDMLESVLGPNTFDRLWATLCMTEGIGSSV